MEEKGKSERIGELIAQSLQSLSGAADANAVLGAPIITASGAQIVPFSRVTFGSLSGGGEYGDTKIVKETGKQSFAGGNGAVVSVKPMGFIIDDGENCRVVRLTDEPLETLIEKAGEALKSALSK